MKWGLIVVALLLFAGASWAQNHAGSPEASPGGAPPEASPSPAGVAPAAPQFLPEPTPVHRSLFGRVIHPFGGGNKADAPANYKDPKLHGLTIAVQVSPEPVKLSEVRQLDVRVILSNRGKKGVELSFGTDQRIEIY